MLKRLSPLLVCIALVMPAQPAIAQPTPESISVSGSNQVPINGLVKLEGPALDQVRRVLVDGVPASFIANSEKLITIRVPMGVEPGDASITLEGDFGKTSLSNLFEITAFDLPPDAKITVGSFSGYTALYTKNYQSRRLSFKIGSTWRVVEKLPRNFTANLTKVGSGTTVTVTVYIDRELVRVQQIQVR